LPKIYSNSSGRQDQMSADVYFVCESRWTTDKKSARRWSPLAGFCYSEIHI
jgi:hypothetical protein